MLLFQSIVSELLVSDIPTYPTVTGLPQHITHVTIAEFLYALCWGSILLLCFTGWGRLTAKLTRIEQVPASVSCVLGMATIVFLGGCLNILHLIYGYLLLVLVAAGFLLYLVLSGDRQKGYFWTPFWLKANRLTRVLVLVALLIMLFRIAATVRLGMFNTLDDGVAYMVFPQKMLALHHFAADPFSERRITSSLGGGYFLQLFVILGTSLSNIPMADRTFGIVLLVGVLFDLGMAIQLSPFQIGLMELLVSLVPQEAMNLTFVVLPCSFLLAVLWIYLQAAEQGSARYYRYIVIAGFMGGAAITLKSTYLPIIVVFAFISCGLCFSGSTRKKYIVSTVVFWFGSLIMMALWMLAMRQTSGTLLFPIFGRGYDFSAYGIFSSISKFHSTRTFVKIFIQGGILASLAVILSLVVGTKNRISRISFCVLTASALAITAFNYKSGGDSIWRYNFPQFFCAVIMFYLATAYEFCSYPKSKRARTVFYLGICAFTSMVFYYDVAGKVPRPFRQMDMEWKDYKPSLQASLSGLPLASPLERWRYHLVENSLPLGSIALENTAYPYLLTYTRGTIFIADWPAAASPYPGWPLSGRSGALIDYLSGYSIRYVVYDYRYAHWTDVEGCIALKNSNSNSQWLRDQWLLSILAHRQFENLRAEYQSIYDDGRIAVIDLTRPQTTRADTEYHWTLNTSKDEMCSAIMTRYLDHPLHGN